MAGNGYKEWTLKTLYNAFLGDDERAAMARSVLDQTDWFTATIDFDPASGQEMPMPLTRFLIRVSCRTTDVPDYPRDRLWRIIEHSGLAIQRLIRSLNESPARDHTVVHYSRVREMDTACFVKLMTRPGRNIREKIAVHPLVPSVHRFQSVDLSENRLLKEYLRQLLPLIELRRKILSKRSGTKCLESQLEEDIRCWLSSEEAASISAWGNTPPNNTMLSHPDYRRIWDAWGWLQTLDQDIARDCNAIASRQDMVSFWTEYALGWKTSPDVSLVEVPLLFNYDKFSVKVWQEFPLLLHHRELEVVDVGDLDDARSIDVESTGSLQHPPALTSPACVDLARLLPEYAVDGEQSLLPIKMLWQQWEDRGTRVEFCLPMADALWQKSGSVTISLGDLFCSDSCTAPGDVQERAARAMVQELHRSFQNDALVWLVPDICGDFETKTLRRNINAVFRHARPLPRSVAAAFERYPHSQMPRRGYRLLVVDEVCGKRFATILTVSYSSALCKELEATRGYYWERHPAVLLSDEDEFHSVINGHIPVLNKNERWLPQDESGQEKIAVDGNELRRQPELSDYDEVLVLNDSPVLGGLRFLELQERSPRAVLWRDHLPPLSIEVLKDGREYDFFLVRKNTSPLETSHVGQGIEIKIPELFFLPVGQPFYSLPLHQGSGRKQLNYNAYLKPNEQMRPNNPSQREIVCVLKLHYNYGADDPYELVFEPAPREPFKFTPIKVEWRRNEGTNEPVDVTTLPVPCAPPQRSWTDFFHFPRKGGQGTEDLYLGLKKRLLLIGDLDEKAYLEDCYDRKAWAIRNKREVGVIEDVGYSACDIRVGRKVLRVPQHAFAEGRIEDYRRGDKVYLSTRFKRKYNETVVEYVTRSPGFPPELERRLREETFGDNGRAWLLSRVYNASWDDRMLNALTAMKQARFFLYTMWGGGRSLSDLGVPPDFRAYMKEKIGAIAKLVDDEHVPEDVSREAFEFLSALHSDALDYTSEYLTQAFCSPNHNDFVYYWRAMAYAIGDASVGCQQNLFRCTAQRIVDLGAEGLKLLSIAAWRSDSVVFLLSDEEVRLVLDALPGALEEAFQKMKAPIQESDIANLMRHDKQLTQEKALDKIKWNRQLTLTAYLDLLLALIRTRKRGGDMMAQAFALQGELVLSLKKIVRRITDFVLDKQWELHSRVVLDVKDVKPVALSNVPDLLFALKMYLTGDSGANKISVLGVEDSD